MKILWAGPAQHTDAMLRGTAPHPATMRWQRIFVGGLREAGCDVRWIGHAPHRTWPWGPIWVPRARSDQLAAIDPAAEDVAYVNIIGCRSASLRRGYRRRILQAVERDPPDVIVSYNADPWMQGAADAAVAAGVPWVPIILDLRDPREDDWRGFRAATDRARGVAFVSDWAFRHAPGTRSHLVSGFVNRRPTDANGGTQRDGGSVVLFSGTHTIATGVDGLIAAIPLLKTQDVTLVITGHGRRVFPFPDLAGRRLAIDDRGLVSFAELDALISRASVLVNPRPVETADSCTNFPSKLLEYLPYEIPIVSTRSPGIGPHYDDVLVYAASDRPEAIAATLDEVLHWGPEKRSSYARRVRTFNAAATPAAAARRFVSWLQECAAGD